MTDSSSSNTRRSSGTAQLSAARQGNGKALGEALEACRVYLKFIAQKELNADLQVKEDASDVVQATLLKAQANFQEFQGTNRETLRIWLRKILLNTLKDLSRKYEQADKRKLGREVRLDDSSQVTLAKKLPAKDETPSKTMMADEIQQSLAEALDHLPADQQQVIYLRSRRHLNYEEIGTILDRSPEAVRQLWYRAVKNLTKGISKEP